MHQGACFKTYTAEALSLFGKFTCMIGSKKIDHTLNYLTITAHST